MGRRDREEVSVMGVDEIKKGPWKEEEDEVLIKHVNKYGPRDWSSIRSKGLLHRTGKSCRLRWVNKLRPNLKNGVKFSAEEERVVIELQAQFGNKWARIATYLSGRTDNDVKNFWSSRQKRLARLLQTPPPPPSKSENSREVAVLHVVPTDMEAPKFCSSSMEEESSSKSRSCSSSLIYNSQMIKMVPLPDLVNPNLLNCEQNLFQLEFDLADQKNPIDESQPQVPFPIISELQPDDPLVLGSQELATSLGDPTFLDIIGNVDASDLANIAQLPLVPTCGGRGDNENPATPDSFFNDFPADIFDHMEPLPSPSEW